MLTKSSWLTGLAAVFLLSVGVPAGAQVGAWGGDRGRGHYDDSSRQAYDNGYRRGAERGERDGRSGRAMNFRDERDYREGDWGYNGRYGSREFYRRTFREGFEAGYYEGYRRYGRGRAVPRYGYPDGRRSPDYGRYPDRDGRYGGYGYGYGHSLAFDNGYRDGLEKGRKDWRSRKSHDLLRHDWYRDGDRHYKREYGPRDQYKDAYRDGFRRGYDEAFQSGRW